MTGWSVRYITHEISLATLLLVFSSDNKEEKPKGLLSDPNLSPDKLRELGFEVI